MLDFQPVVLEMTTLSTIVNAGGARLIAVDAGQPFFACNP